LLSTFVQGLRRFVSELKGVCLVGEAFFFAGSCVAAKALETLSVVYNNLFDVDVAFGPRKDMCDISAV